MSLQEILEDIHALREDLESYERKYGVLSETFYESHCSGEEPSDDSWVLDWADWAGAYQVYTRRHEQYLRAIEALRKRSNSLAGVIERTARHEPIPVAP